MGGRGEVYGEDGGFSMGIDLSWLQDRLSLLRKCKKGMKRGWWHDVACCLHDEASLFLHLLQLSPVCRPVS